MTESLSIRRRIQVISSERKPNFSSTLHNSIPKLAMCTHTQMPSRQGNERTKNCAFKVLFETIENAAEQMKMHFLYVRRFPVEKIKTNRKSPTTNATEQFIGIYLVFLSRNRSTLSYCTNFTCKYRIPSSCVHSYLFCLFETPQMHMHNLKLNIHALARQMNALTKAENENCTHRTSSLCFIYSMHCFRLLYLVLIYIYIFLHLFRFLLFSEKKSLLSFLMVGFVLSHFRFLFRSIFFIASLSHTHITCISVWCTV